MNIEFRIDTCYDCKHLDHTGGFTKGGAKPCCNHSNTIKQKGENCFNRVIPYRSEYSDVGNRKVRVAKTIPFWCPLKNGGSY